MTDYYAYDNGLPCTNPSCKSHGVPHPNCKCYSKAYAKGGSVCSENLPHDPSCKYYADGGQVAQPRAPDDAPNTLAFYAAHRGLLGILSEAGHPKLSNPDEHHQKIHALRNNPKEDLHGHNLASGVSKKHLEPIMQHLANPLQTQEPDPHALKGAIDYLHSSLKGKEALESHAGSLIGTGKMDLSEDKEERDALKAKLQSIDENPASMLNVGGSLGHYLPEHSSLLASHAAIAKNYLDSIKPKAQQAAPLDPVMPISKGAQASYDRQLDLAQQPLLVLKNIKKGTLLPSDIQTIKTIYPSLYQNLTKSITEQMIEAKTKGKEISHKQKQSMSLFLGQPLDYTQTSAAMQAILKANGPQGINAPQLNSKAKHSLKSGITGPELKAIEKSDSMYQTSLESREINRNKP